MRNNSTFYCLLNGVKVKVVIVYFEWGLMSPWIKVVMAVYAQQTIESSPHGLPPQQTSITLGLVYVCVCLSTFLALLSLSTFLALFFSTFFTFRPVQPDFLPRKLPPRQTLGLVRVCAWDPVNREVTSSSRNTPLKVKQSRIKHHSFHIHAQNEAQTWDRCCSLCSHDKPRTFLCFLHQLFASSCLAT